LRGKNDEVRGKKKRRAIPRLRKEKEEGRANNKNRKVVRGSNANRDHEAISRSLSGGARAKRGLKRLEYHLLEKLEKRTGNNRFLLVPKKKEDVATI